MTKTHLIDDHGERTRGKVVRSLKHLAAGYRSSVQTVDDTPVGSALDFHLLGVD